MEEKNKKSINPCNHCNNDTGDTCPVRMCYEYSRWENDGTATSEVINKVLDFQNSDW